MLVVEDTPEYLPFLSKKDSGSLKQNMIYVCRGTSCEIANEEEIQAMLDRRINYLHPFECRVASTRRTFGTIKSSI